MDVKTFPRISKVHPDPKDGRATLTVGVVKKKLTALMFKVKRVKWARSRSSRDWVIMDQSEASIMMAGQSEAGISHRVRPIPGLMMVIIMQNCCNVTMSADFP